MHKEAAPGLDGLFVILFAAMKLGMSFFMKLRGTGWYRCPSPCCQVVSLFMTMKLVDFTLFATSKLVDRLAFLSWAGPTTPGQLHEQENVLCRW